MDNEQKMALRMFDDHDCNGSIDRVARENCGACVLAGYGEITERSNKRPNYSGWARLYVQAKKPIPAKYARAFRQELESKNEAYAKALWKDVESYGLTIKSV